jgi:hypothetical protein
MPREFAVTEIAAAGELPATQLPFSSKTVLMVAQSWETGGPRLSEVFQATLARRHDIDELRIVPLRPAKDRDSFRLLRHESPVVLVDVIVVPVGVVAGELLAGSIHRHVIDGQDAAASNLASVPVMLISPPMDQYWKTVCFFHAWKFSRPVPKRYCTSAPSSEAHRSAPFLIPVNFRDVASKAMTPTPLGASRIP